MSENDTQPRTKPCQAMRTLHKHMMLLGVLLLACGNGIVREEGTASDSAADGSDAAALPRLSVGNNLCTTYQEDLLCARFHSRPRKVRRFPITRDILAQSSELTFLFDDGRLITLSNNSDDAPRIKAEGIRYAIRLKDRLLLLNERLQLFDPSTEILDPIEQLLHPNDYTRKPFLPEPVSFAAYFEHLEQLKRVEHSVCALGDGLFGCYALPLGVYLPPDPSPSLQGVWGTSIPCAFRDDFGWRAREVSWRDFAGGDYCSDDSPELFADPPLCALEEPDGAWVCGAFNAFMRGEPLEPVLDAEGHAVRGGVKLDYETISAFYDGPNGSFYMLREDGTLWSFGNNVFGQLGDGSTQSRDWAAPVELPAKVLRFEPSASGGCALLEDLRVFCWGSVSGLTGEVTPPEAWPPQPSLVPLEIDLEALAASAEPGKGLEAAKP